MDALQRALLLAGFTLSIALLAGAIPMWRRVREQENLLRRLTGIAAGILLASALLVVIPEGFEAALHGDEDAHDEAGLAAFAGLALLLGFLCMMALEAYGFGHDIHEEHHDHAEDHGHDHVNHPSNPSSVVLGLSLHALTDGLAIGAAVASESLLLTLTVYIGVIAHKVPAAFSVGVFAMHERGEVKAAFRDLAVFSIATPVAILASFWFLADLSTGWLGLAILFAGGTFLYVATVDVLPDVHSGAAGRTALVQVLIGAVGLWLALQALELSGLLAHAH